LENWHDSTVYEIYHHWRHRYPKGVFENREHIFSAQIPRDTPIMLQPDEHVAYGWFGAEDYIINQIIMKLCNSHGYGGEGCL